MQHFTPKNLQNDKMRMEDINWAAETEVMLIVNLILK